MKRGENGNYEVRKSRYKHPAYTRVAVVKGLMAADNMVERLNRGRTEVEVEEGWHYAAYKTTALVTAKAIKSKTSTQRVSRRPSGRS